MRAVAWRAWVCGLVMLVVAGCSGFPQLSGPVPSPSASGTATVGRTTVGSVGGVSLAGLTVADAQLDDEQEDTLSSWGDFPMAVGQPTEIRLDGEIPADGIQVTRTYAQPLPADATATVAYFDENLGTWKAVPSEVAQDRRSVSAVVHHLSLWTDFVSGTQSALQSIGDAAAGAADWAYYNVGKVFDTRVEAPECSATTPDWVDDTTFIETQRNNSVLFCVGTDPKQPGILVIKARSNRGFGFNAEVLGKTDWTNNSTFDRNDLEQAMNVLANLDEVFGDSLREVTSDGRMTGPGQEYSFGISEQEARTLPAFLALRMSPQPVLPFLVTTLAQLVGAELTNQADGYVAAAMALASCSKDVRAASDGAGLTKAALSCVEGLDEQFARQLALYLLKRGVADPGKVAGKVVGKLSVYLACIGPVFNGMNYFAERQLIENARTVHVFPTTVKVLLAPGKVGRFAFGTPYRTVEDELLRQLGTPDSATEDEGCPMAPIWTRNLRWKNFWVAFEADQPTQTDQMFLSHWGITQGGSLPQGVRLADSLPASTTFAKLRASYPGITIDDWFGGGPYISDLGNSVSYDWVDERGSAVVRIMSGPMRPCE